MNVHATRMAKGTRQTSLWLLTAMFLAAALAGRSVLISATPVWSALGLALVGASVCGLFKRLGRGHSTVAHLWSLAVALVVAAVVWWTGGRTQVSTWWTAAAFGSLAWAWCCATLSESAVLSSMPRRLALFAAGVIAYQVCSDELYDFPILLMRGVAIGLSLLAFALWLVEGWSGAALNRNAEVREAEASSASPIGGGSLLAPALALLGFVVAILGALALDPVQGWASRLQLYFWEGAEVEQLEDFDGEGSVYSGTAGAGGEGGRSLPRRADIQLGNGLRAVIRVADRQQFQDLVEAPLYVRTFTLSVIEADGVLTPLRRGEWIYDGEDGANDGRVRPDRGLLKNGLDGEADEGVRHTVFINASESSALPMLAGVSSVELNEVYEYADDWYQLALQEGQEMVAFRAVSDFSRVVADTSAVDEGRIPADWKVDRSAPVDYLKLPAAALSERLLESVHEIGAATTEASLASRLEALRGFIQTRCRYSLEYDNPEDLPAVENFLYAERRGHCELFATATVMLLRSMDIPARVAYGFSGGTARGADRVIAFRDRDFHAWAEVLVEGRGWIVFDTTPVGDGARSVANAVSGSGNRGSDGSGIPDLSGYQLLQGEAVEVAIRRSWVPAWLRAILNFGAFYLTEICLLSLALFMGLWLMRVARVRRLRRRVGSGQMSDTGVQERSGGYLDGFFQMWAERGVTRRPGQTIREFVRRLKADGRCVDEFDRLLHYVYAVRYAGGNRDSATERQLRREVREFRRRVEAMEATEADSA